MIENSQLLKYVGETKTENLIRNIQNEYFEIVNKNFQQKENPVQNIKANALITVSEKNDDEIKGIGMSCVNDLINDNFGLFWGAVLSRQTQINMIRVAGDSIFFDIYRQADSFSDTNGASPKTHALGCQMKIGSGINIPTRQDFDLQTSIGTFFNPVGSMGYNSGLGQGSITANSPVLVGSGTISEAGIYFRFFSRNTTLTELCLASRDLISPAVNFLNGQVATLEYTFQLS